MQRHTPLRDDILYILSYMSIHDLSCPANTIAKMIYKHSGRYRDLESARKNIERELRRLREKGLVSQVHQEFFGSARKEWVLTDKGIQFILEGRKNLSSTVTPTEKSLVTSSQAPLSNKMLQIEGGQGGEGY